MRVALKLCLALGVASMVLVLAAGAPIVKKFSSNKAKTSGDEANHLRGFVCPNAVLTNATGIITDGSPDPGSGGDTRYGISFNCKYTIAPPNSVSLTLTQLWFHTETNFDVVFFFACTSEFNCESAPFKELSGIPAAANQVITTPEGYGAVQIMFKSDDSYVLEGWGYEWSATVVPQNLER